MAAPNPHPMRTRIPNGGTRLRSFLAYAGRFPFRFAMHSIFLWMACMFSAALANTGSSHDRPTTGPPEGILDVTARPLTRDQARALRDADSLLIMIPGVNSGDPDERYSFLNHVRRQGRQEVAIFYDWEEGNWARKMASPSAIQPAVARLITLCESFMQGAGDRKTIDLLAHSAGTVVVNQAAIAIVQNGSSLRFRHVLLLGTALDAEEPLSGLKSVSHGVLNVHSAYDAVNRNINDKMGQLNALEGRAHRNLSMDRSLGGRIMRHHAFLSSNPENWFQYGTYLSGGEWPQPDPAIPGEDRPPGEFHRLTLWVRDHPDEAHSEVRARLPQWLGHSSPPIRYYAVILAGLLNERPLGPVMQALLEDEQTPPYLRKEIYQALGNFKDGTYIDFLQSSRQFDRACDEEIRDILRALKRQRVEAIR